MNDITQIILALAAAIGTLAIAGGYVVRKLGDARAKSIEAEGAARAKAIEAEGAAKAKAIITAAETDKTEAETTGRFLTAQDKDRATIDSLVADVRAELRQCERDRIENRDEIASLRDKNTKLEVRVAELERSRGALWDELQLWKRSADSGGAYPGPETNERKDR